MELYQITGRMHKLELVRMLAQRKEIRKDGLYVGQMPVLNYLAQHPGCTQVEMADFLQVTPASIALSTKRLQKTGYLTKEVDAKNLRCKRLYISAQGEQVRARCRQKMECLDRRAFAGFSQDELCALAQMLDRITINLTGEAENIVNGETFGSLHRELEHMDRAEKKG